ncbi:MAG: translocation/assembly module TamB domain-containing protein [Bryobacteraceae bacterium]|nr:translocation/assembly module TamB domain-containing protein [Bryobacteraceae bacterium]
MATWRRRAIYFSALPLLVICAWWMLHGDAARRAILSRLETETIQMRAGRLDYDLLTLSARLQDVTLLAKQAPDLPPFLRAKDLRLRLNWRTLSSLSLDLDQADIEGVQINLVLQPNGRNNLPRATSGESSPWLIRRLRARGALEVNSGSQGSVIFPAWNLQLSGEPATRQHTLLLNAGAGTANYQGRRIPLDQLSLKGILTANAFESLQATVASQLLQVTATGRLPFRGPIAITAHAGLDTSFLGIPLQGKVTSVSEITGLVGQLQLTSSLSSVALTYENYPPVALQAKAEYRQAQDRLLVTEAALKTAYGGAQVTADVALRQGESRLSAQVPNLVLPDFPQKISSATSVTVEARWPSLDFASATATGNVRLKPLPSPDRIPVAADIGFAGNLASLRIAVRSLAAAGAEASGILYLEGQKNLRGEFVAGTNSLARVLSTPDIDGPAALTGVIGGTIAAPVAAATLSAEDPAKGAKLTAALTYEDRVLRVSALDARWKGQLLRGDGSLALEGNLLEFTAFTDGVRAEKLLDGPITGSLRLEAHGGGTLEHPTAQITLTGNNLTVAEESLGPLEGQASLDGRLLRVSQLRLPRQGFTATGTYDLAQKLYTLDAQATALRLRYGQFAVKAAGQGTLDNPQLTAQASSPTFTYGHRLYGPVEATLDVKDHFADISARAPNYQAAAKAHLSTSAPYAGNFTLEANSIPLEDPLSGKLVVNAQGEVSLEKWQSGNAEVAVQLLGVKYNGEPLTSQKPLRARIAEGTMQLEPATLTLAGSTLSLTGSLPVDPRSTAGSLQLQGALDLAGLTKLIPEWTASGILKLNGEVKGNLQRIEPQFTATLRDAIVTPPGLNPVVDLQLDANLRDGRLTLDRLTGNWAKAQLQASGDFPLGLLPKNLPIDFARPSGPAKLSFDARGLDVAALAAVPANTGGRITLHVEAESAKAEISSIRARAVLEELTLRAGDFTVQQTSPSVVIVEDGNARIENFALAGPGTELVLRGKASLLGDNPVALRLAGSIETGVLSNLVAPAKLRGPARIQLSAYGPARALKAAGFVDVANGQLLLPRPRLAVDQLQARVNFTGEQVSVEKFEGLLNGGTISAKGGLRFAGGETKAIDLSLNAQNVYFDYPYGLRTLSGGSLTLKQIGQRIVLGGDIVIDEGSFRELVTIEGNLLAALNPTSEDAFGVERNAYLERTQFDVKLRTDSPLLVRNNLAKAGVNADLRLTGNYYQPALLGRVTLEEGGELYFSERSYAVERGIVTFTNEQKIEPIFDILARTRAANHDISLLIAGGGPEKISTTLTSDPALPEQDIVAILITGKAPEEYKRSDTATLASRQALSYFAGSFGSRFTRQIERATGLSTVRVEPDLIANESNPTARLTVGQDLSKAARVIYSMNLANGGDQIYVAEYDLTKRFTTRGVKQIDNTYRFEFRHDLRFGGQKPPTRGQLQDPRRIGRVEVPADTGIPEKKLRDQFRNKPGKRYDFFEIRKGLDRLERLYAKADLLEARVRVRRDEKEKTVNLALDIEPGPALNFAYEGWDPGRKLRNQLRTLWSNGVFDAQRLDDSVHLLQTSLVQEGYLEASIAPKIKMAERKQVTFDIQRGTKYTGAAIEFPGASPKVATELAAVLKRPGLRSALYLDASRVRDLLQNYYRERGYLDAVVKLPVAQFSQGQATVRIPVVEGTLYRVAAVKFEGAAAIPNASLARSSGPRSGEAFQLPLRQISVERIRELYVAAGYHDAQVEAAISRDAEKVDVTYKIVEGPKEVVQKIEVSGNDATSANLVKSQLAIKEGAALEPGKLAEARRNLYSTGAYSLVDLEKVPLGDLSSAGTKPMLLRAKVREVQPFDIRYGAYFDTDRGPGAVVDFTNRNSLGSARAIGGRLRYDGDFREGRVFFSQPFLRRFPVQTIFSGFVNRALLPTFITDRTGVSVQQETRFKKRYLVNYGYRLERVHTYEKVPNEFLPFDVTLRVAPLTFTMNRESRDDFLDATRGSFLSHAFEWSPELLGSDVRFIRYYAQYFKYVALGRPTEIPLSGGLKKPRLVYAGGARVGLARGLGGQQLVQSERFFAGGGTTLRGFAQNTLGEKDFLGEPAGGNAVVLFNNELRFPMASIFDGVGFVDLGNTYRRAADFSLSDLRKAAGFGLRIRTPYFLIRLDYGFKLDRRPGESRGGFFFSIGQAF